jgi:hypothetical protein
VVFAFSRSRSLREICRSCYRSHAGRRSHNETSGVYERTTRGATAFADCSITPVITCMIAARIALLLNLQKKRLETVKAAQWS